MAAFRSRSEPVARRTWPAVASVTSTASRALWSAPGGRRPRRWPRCRTRSVAGSGRRPRRCGRTTPSSVRRRSGWPSSTLRWPRARAAATTADTYRQRLSSVVLPAMGQWRLRECTVPQLDAFFTDLASTQGPQSRKTVRTVVSLILRVAVQHEAIPDNPVRHLDPIEVGSRKPRALTAAGAPAVLGLDAGNLRGQGGGACAGQRSPARPTGHRDVHARHGRPHRRGARRAVVRRRPRRRTGRRWRRAARGTHRGHHGQRRPPPREGSASSRWQDRDIAADRAAATVRPRHARQARAARARG